MTIRYFSKTVIALCIGVMSLLSVQSAVAADASAAKVLQVTGTADTPIGLNIEDLREIGSEEFSTSTIWTKGVHRFEGVPLKALLAHLEAEGTAIEATAINDYAIEIPMNHALSDGPMIAFAMDGAPMSRRAKGPLWIVYPFDSSSKFRTETIYARSIWQLNRLHIIK